MIRYDMISWAATVLYINFVHAFFFFLFLSSAIRVFFSFGIFGLSFWPFCCMCVFSSLGEASFSCFLDLPWWGRRDEGGVYGVGRERWMGVKKGGGGEEGRRWDGKERKGKKGGKGREGKGREGKGKRKEDGWKRKEGKEGRGTLGKRGKREEGRGKREEGAI